MNATSASRFSVDPVMAVVQLRVALVATQNEPRAARSYYAVVDATIDRLEMDIVDDASVGLVISTVYKGRQPLRKAASCRLWNELNCLRRRNWLLSRQMECP